MILQQLYQDAANILGGEMPPPMYDRKPVRWVILLKLDGTLEGEGFISLGGDKETKRGQPRMVPYVGRTSSVRAILLSDSPAYVLGFGPEDRNAAKKHEAFKALVKQCAEETNDPAVQAVSVFLSQWSLELGLVPSELMPADLITFRVDGEWVVDDPAVRQFWARSARAEGDVESGSQCLVTGVFGPVEKSLPGMIKRVPGGQTSGIAIVSANEDAFESYGLTRAQTSPISREAAETFTKALNHLIVTRETHITIGNLVYVFWVDKGDANDLITFLDTPDPDRVRELLNAARSGERKHLYVDDRKFYAFALSASGARAVVRDWLKTTVSDARGRLAHWFASHEMISYDGQDTSYFSIYKLAASVYRDARKEMDNQTPQALLRSALHGDAVPRTLLAKAVMRCRAEQRVTHPRAALIKAALLSLNPNYTLEDAQRMTNLDHGREDAPYLCGRLFAELEAIQRAALGPINTTMIDRYFGAASTTPSKVLSSLVAHANKAHLPKIRKTRLPAYLAMQERLEQILKPMTAFPKTLTLENQAAFILGFYHQRAENRADIAKAKDRKARGEATEQEAALAEIDNNIEN
ncbi:MAG: CRISPR-associated protein Cas8c/Csd1, subtype [Capsulimonas sp.]|nr:CRISPR-associated protein Cas8c/Csd1, subtype [Capsulimonas sp.]